MAPSHSRFQRRFDRRGGGGGNGGRFRPYGGDSYRGGGGGGGGFSELTELMREREWRELEKEEKEEKAREEKERREEREKAAEERKRDREEYKQLLKDQSEAHKETLKELKQAQLDAAKEQQKAIADAAKAASTSAGTHSASARGSGLSGGGGGNDQDDGTDASMPDWRAQLAAAKAAAGPRKQTVRPPIDVSEWCDWSCSPAEARKILAVVKTKGVKQTALKNRSIDEIADVLEDPWKRPALEKLHKENVGTNAPKRWNKADIMVSLIAHLVEA